MDDSTKGFLALISSAFLYATFGILVRFVDTMFGSFTQVFVRLLLGALFLLIFLIVINGKLRLDTRKDYIKVTLLGLLTPLLVVAFTLSIIFTKIANTVFMLYAGNIIASFFISLFFFKEKMERKKLVALLLTPAGLSFFVNINELLVAEESFGLFLGLISGVMEAISNSLRKLIETRERNTIVFNQFFVAAVVGFFLMLISGEQIIKEVSLLSSFAIVIFSILLIFLGNLLIYGFQNLDVNLGTLVLSTESLFALLLGFLFFYELPDMYELLGGVLLILSLITLRVDVNLLVGKGIRDN